MAHITIEGMGVRFLDRNRNPIDVLKNVDLTIEEGQFVSVIGHSGCGKSTMLNTVAGFVKTHTGTVTVAGDTVKQPGPDRMMVFQNHALLPWMTVRENVSMAAKAVYGSMPKSEVDRMVSDHLEMVGLEHAGNKRPDEISGGMRQRAGIARALITKPKVLLLDEPFGALDALTRGKLQEKLLEIWEQHRITVMLITHDVDEAIFLSDRVVMMSNGPEAKVAEILDIDLPRPRRRMEAVNHPSYYRYRNHLVRFLHHNKQKKAGDVVEHDPDLVRIGYIPLSDCAPLLLAEQRELFAKRGLRVELSREPSWAAVQKGLETGRLQASMLLAPMALAHNLREGATPASSISASMVLSRNGNAVTFSKKMWERGVRSLEGLRTYIEAQSFTEQVTLGVVFESSMHNLLLRHWLREGGIDPDRDVELVTIPPPQMLANLQLGNIDGFIVGEPWNSLAVQKDLGRIAVTSQQIWGGHPEKLLGCLSSWAAENPKKLAAVTAAVLEACHLCQNLDNRSELVRLLSERKILNVDPACMEFTLRDQITLTPEGDVTPAPGFHLFSGVGVSALREQELAWIQKELVRAGQIAENGESDFFLREIHEDACSSLDLKEDWYELPPLLAEPASIHQHEDQQEVAS